MLAPPLPYYQGADRSNLYHERESALYYTPAYRATLSAAAAHTVAVGGGVPQ